MPDVMMDRDDELLDDEEKEQELSERELTPQEYFDIVKERKHNITDEQLRRVYGNCMELLEKYKITGQTAGIRKLMFHLSCIEKEREIVRMGINTFVYRDDIEFYISNVASDVVKIIDLESYEREIPDEIVDVIAKVKDKFDQLYIVFTDYTGKVERQVEKERRKKDPILFGTFQDRDSKTVIDRFYYLGDWVDEYCDLTLDKMVNETEKYGTRNIVHTIKTPDDMKELKEQLAALEKKDDRFIARNIQVDNKKSGFFKRIKTFISRNA